MTKSILLLLLFITIVIRSRIANPNTCDQCKIVVKCVYGHFGRSVPSKRVMSNKFEHVCKRYPNYRRSCISLFRNNTDYLYTVMRPGTYDLVNICTTLKECNQTMNKKVDGEIATTDVDGNSIISNEQK